VSDMKPKIAFGMIVFEGDYFLQHVLEQVYPVAAQILIAEGPVNYFQRLGRTTSTDRTNDILAAFPDPEKKIVVIHGRYKEKDDQCQAYTPFLRPDIDYLWNLDADECYSSRDLSNIIDVLRSEEPTSVGVQSVSFFGGFDRYLTGFEQRVDNFLRIFKVVPGARWLTHRPPTIKYPMGAEPPRRHINSDLLYELCGGVMHHYSYVFPRQVFRKVSYYKSAVSRERCLDSYFDRVYKPWVLGGLDDRNQVERQFSGVHEFRPEFRGDCFTAPYTGIHPESINFDFKQLSQRLEDELLVLRENEQFFANYCR
jgi:hypothetical protein